MFNFRKPKPAHRLCIDMEDKYIASIRPNGAGFPAAKWELPEELQFQGQGAPDIRWGEAIVEAAKAWAGEFGFVPSADPWRWGLDEWQFPMVYLTGTYAPRATHELVIGYTPYPGEGYEVVIRKVGAEEHIHHFSEEKLPGELARCIMSDGQLLGNGHPGMEDPRKWEATASVIAQTWSMGYGFRPAPNSTWRWRLSTDEPQHHYGWIAISI